jgi:hypothetical protein
VSRPSWSLRPDCCYWQTLANFLMCEALSDERTGLPSTIPAGSLQHSQSFGRVLRDSRPYFTVSDSRLHQPGEPVPHIFIPQEQSGPVTAGLKPKLCYDRQSVYQSVLVSGTHLGPITRFVLTVRQLLVCGYGAPSLTRGM